MNRIYCASDLHLGFEDSNYPKIIEFFDLVKKDADQLILIGDCFDLWRCPIETIINEEPYKTAYEALVSTAAEVPTILIKGNHDYQLQKKISIPNVRIVGDYTQDNIYFTHGHRFDIQQRFGSFLYGWLVNQFPYLYQRFFKTPSQIPRNEYARADLTTRIHAEAKRFADGHKFDFVCMGHTHDPIIDEKIIDAGDMIDSLSYVVITDGVPELLWMER